METVYIYGHLGLGDHIICNGLYREIIKSSNKYIMFVKHHNIETVSFMLRDIENIYYHGVEDDEEVLNLLKSIKYDHLIIIGFDSNSYSIKFDEYFYKQHNIEFSKRWSSFICNRDYESEKKIYDMYGVEKNKYVFIHDDKSRGYEIDEKHIKNTNLPIIRPKINLTKNSFDYCLLMENSIESHFIDSSFRLIFDSLQLRNTNIFFHVNLKNGVNRGYLPTSKLDFVII